MTHERQCSGQMDQRGSAVTLVSEWEIDRDTEAYQQLSDWFDTNLTSLEDEFKSFSTPNSLASSSRRS